MTAAELNNLFAKEIAGWMQIENVNSMAAGGMWRGYPPVPIIGEPKQPVPWFVGSADAVLPWLTNPIEISRGIAGDHWHVTMWMRNAPNVSGSALTLAEAAALVLLRSKGVAV